jgi:hypothetical protein
MLQIVLHFWQVTNTRNFLHRRGRALPLADASVAAPNRVK